MVYLRFVEISRNRRQAAAIFIAGVAAVAALEAMLIHMILP